MADRVPIAKYRFKIIVLNRVLTAVNATGEAVESWPQPTAGTNEYYAARDALTGSERIVEGLRQTLGTMVMRVRDLTVNVNSVDQVQIKATGEQFNVVGVQRDVWDTVITLERITQQAVNQ